MFLALPTTRGSVGAQPKGLWYLYYVNDKWYINSVRRHLNDGEMDGFFLLNNKSVNPISTIHGEHFHICNYNIPIEIKLVSLYKAVCNKGKAQLVCNEFPLPYLPNVCCYAMCPYLPYKLFDFLPPLWVLPPSVSAGAVLAVCRVPGTKQRCHCRVLSRHGAER